MVEAVVIILVVLACTMATAVIIFLVLAQVQYSKNAGNTGSIQLCTETVNINTLTQLTSENNCVYQGETGRYYYIGNTGSYDYVVSAIPTSASNVCAQYCDQVSNGNCTGPNYNNLTAQQNYNICMSQLGVTGCIPPLPLAAIGTQFYYAYSPTNVLCEGPS